MRLIRIDKRSERDRARLLLEANGIPVFVPQMTWYDRHGVGVYVCINEQFDDALALLSDPAHEVRSPVDVQKFHGDEVRGDPSPSFVRAGVIVIAALAALIGAIVLVRWWLDMPPMLRRSSDSSRIVDEFYAV